MSESDRLRYECLEPGCGWSTDAAGEDEEELVASVQEHMGDKHDTFELEDVIIDNARANPDASQTRSS